MSGSDSTPSATTRLSLYRPAESTCATSSPPSSSKRVCSTALATAGTASRSCLVRIKRRETRLDPVALGLQGAPGPKGDPGMQGPQGLPGSAAGATVRDATGAIVGAWKPEPANAGQAVMTLSGHAPLRARAMASRATIRCSTRQSEFCGEDTTAGVDMRKLRFRGRAYCPGGGVPSRTVSPHPVPHQRDGIGRKAGDEAGRPKAISRAGQRSPGWTGKARDTAARI